MRTSPMVTVPRTPSEGLVISMALRFDHGLLLHDAPMLFPFVREAPGVARARTLASARETHRLILATGEDAGDGQVRLPAEPAEDVVEDIARAAGIATADVGRAWEEITGRGYHCAAREDWYVRSMAGAQTP